MDENINFSNIATSVADNMRRTAADKSLSLASSAWDEIAALIKDFTNVSIDDYPDFNTRNYGYMLRLLTLGAYDKRLTQAMMDSGNYVAPDGMSDRYSPQANRPNYVRNLGLDYMEYATSARLDELSGKNTTRQHGSQEQTGYSLYPRESLSNRSDADSQGASLTNAIGVWNTDDGDTTSNTSNYSNTKGLLYKMQRLFDAGKIHTLVGRFGTNTDGHKGPESSGDAKTNPWGESKGKNLLTEEAENNGYAYNVNGYENPYCRVWTYHHQYDTYAKLIRPFGDDDEKFDLKKIHQWENFDSPLGGETYKWKGKEGGADWDKSVLSSPSGMVKIAPKYKGGGQKNVHPKDVMFSIENLAWKDYDPYSFEKCLSWEQRGPLGGRIMWFPPYGLEFSEQAQVSWNQMSFIGRGEKVYTYTNTDRTGNLSFLMVTDHPSILDYSLKADEQPERSKKMTDTDWYRFFAGCSSGVFDKAEPTYLTDEYLQTGATEVIEVEKEVPPELEKPTDSIVEVEFNVYFPNNYSGWLDTADDHSNVNSIAYLIAGRGAEKDNQRNGNQWDLGSKSNSWNDKILKLWEDDGRSDSPLGYEMGSSGISYSGQQDTDKILGCGAPKVGWSKNTEHKEYVVNEDKKYSYRVNGRYQWEIWRGKWGDERNVDSYPDTVKNTYGQNLTERGDWDDSVSMELNSALTNQDVPDSFYTFAEIALVMNYISADEGKPYNQRILKQLTDTLGTQGVERAQELYERIKDMKLISIFSEGFAPSSVKGRDQTQKQITESRNTFLALDRAHTVFDWVRKCKKEWGGMTNTAHEPGRIENIGEIESVNSAKEKKLRRAHVKLTFKTENVQPAHEVTAADDNGATKYIGWTNVGQTSTGLKIYTYSGTNEASMKKYGNGQWVETSPDSGKLIKYEEYTTVARAVEVGNGTYEFTKEVRKPGAEPVNDGNGERNTLRYDQEYHFFKEMQKNDPVTFKKFTDKIKYFSPAFHSMTPEGFNARLTFLHQCTRQGATITASDQESREGWGTANNLAFGRPPFCVLRIGDFYNQMIVINNISIDYRVSDGITWDMNPEGTGMQPMLCKVSINFNFIGGGDMGGPVRRLQNALTFNYYSNTSLYDNRADRVAYGDDDGKTNYETMGGAENNKYHVLNDGGYYTAQMYKPPVDVGTIE